MSALPRRVALRVLLRSLLVQASWNYETLIGTGFAFTVLPVLRHLYPGDTDAFRSAIARHRRIFNSHPYLATVAAGAVSRLEADGADPAIIERFKSALRGSLGSIGDQLIWSAWRPAAVLLGIALILAGAAWWLGLVVFLMVYNTLHLALRVWGWRIGAQAGIEVSKALRQAPLMTLAQRAADAGAALAGFATVLAAQRATAIALPPAAVVGAVAVAMVAGAWLGPRTRMFFAPALALLWIYAIVSL